MSEKLKLDEDDLGTILAIGNNEQSGRVTNFELKELVRVYRGYAISQARLSEAVKVLEAISNAAFFIGREQEYYMFPVSVMERVDSFLATLGEENEA